MVMLLSNLTRKMIEKDIKNLFDFVTFKIEFQKIFKVQNPKPEIQNPKILFRDYVQKNLKISRPESITAI